MDDNLTPLEALKQARADISSLVETATEKLNEMGAGVDPAERTYRIYVERIDKAIAALSQPPAVPEGWVLTDEIVRTAMQDAWDDYCSDAQAFPHCFRIERGPKLHANFELSNFAGFVRLALEDGLRSAAPPAPQAEAWRPIAETDKTGDPLFIGWLDSTGAWQTRRAWWDPEFESEWDDQADDISHIGAWTDGAVKSRDYQERVSYEPTHVAPLPATPAGTHAHDDHGWKYWNPDTGIEWAPYHPVGSGECDDAEDVVAMTYGEFVSLYPQEPPAMIPITPTDTPESVAARLEGWNHCWPADHLELDVPLAAILLRAQEAEIARLSAQNSGLKKWYAARLAKCIEAEAALATSEERERGLREALEREAAWNEVEAATCDRQAEGFRGSGGDRMMRNRCDAAADAHRKAVRRLRATVATGDALPTTPASPQDAPATQTDEVQP